jgi:hypothetical protein
MSQALIIRSANVLGLADLGLELEVGRAEGEAEEGPVKPLLQRAAEEAVGLKLVGEGRQQVRVHEADLDAWVSKSRENIKST